MGVAKKVISNKTSKVNGNRDKSVLRTLQSSDASAEKTLGSEGRHYPKAKVRIRRQTLP